MYYALEYCKKILRFDSKKEPNCVHSKKIIIWGEFWEFHCLNNSLLSDQPSPVNFVISDKKISFYPVKSDNGVFFYKYSGKLYHE